MSDTHRLMVGEQEAARGSEAAMWDQAWDMGLVSLVAEIDPDGTVKHRQVLSHIARIEHVSAPEMRTR